MLPLLSSFLSGCVAVYCCVVVHTFDEQKFGIESHDDGGYPFCAWLHKRDTIHMWPPKWLGRMYGTNPTDFSVVRLSPREHDGDCFECPIFGGSLWRDTMRGEVLFIGNGQKRFLHDASRLFVVVLGTTELNKNAEDYVPVIFKWPGEWQLWEGGRGTAASSYLEISQGFHPFWAMFLVSLIPRERFTPKIFGVLPTVGVKSVVFMDHFHGVEAVDPHG